MMQAVAEGPRASDRFTCVTAAFVSGIAARGNSIQFGANFTATLAQRLNSSLEGSDSLAASNLGNLISHFYITGLISAACLYTLLDFLRNKFEEQHVAMMHLILKACGLKLRSEDSVAMKVISSSFTRCSFFSFVFLITLHVVPLLRVDLMHSMTVWKPISSVRHLTIMEPAKKMMRAPEMCSSRVPLLDPDFWAMSNGVIYIIRILRQALVCHQRSTFCFSWNKSDCHNRCMQHCIQTFETFTINELLITSPGVHATFQESHVAWHDTNLNPMCIFTAFRSDWRPCIYAAKTVASKQADVSKHYEARSTYVCFLCQ